MDKLKVISEAIRVLQLEAQAIEKCAELLRVEPYASSFSQAIQLMQSALAEGGKIVVTGVGKSGKVGQKIAATLCSTGSLAVYLHPTEGLHGDLGLLTPKDVVFALSYTGNTDELIRLLPSLKSLRVPLIAVGGNPA